MNLEDSADISFSVARRIREVRVWSGISQKSFAEKLGVSRSYMSEVESRKRKPNIEIIVGIANKFEEINPYWLLTGAGSMLKVTQSDEDKQIIAEHDNLDNQAVRFVLEEFDRILKAADKKNTTSMEVKTTLFCLLYSSYIYHYRRQLTVEDEASARRMAEHLCLRLAADLERDWVNTAIGLGLVMPIKHDFDG